MPRAAAEVETRDAVAVRPQRANQIDGAREGAAERREIGNLRADMHVHPVHRDSRHRRGAAAERRGAGDGDAELVAAPAGRDLVVRARVDIRVDAQRDLRRHAERRRHFRHQREFGFGLDVQLHDSVREREGDLRPHLADAGKQDVGGSDPGGERAADLALAHHVGAGAEPRQSGDHRLVGVGLHRIGDQRVAARERTGEGAVVPGERRRRIAIERRADVGGDVGEWHLLRRQLAAAPREMVHSAVPRLFGVRAGAGHGLRRRPLAPARGERRGQRRAEQQPQRAAPGRARGRGREVHGAIHR